MNIHDIQRCFTLFCAAGGIACIAAILLYAARHQLRQLFDRWLALGRLGQCVSLLMLTVFVLYGGTKPVTNEVEGMTLHCPPPPLLSTLFVTPPLLSTSPSGQQLNMIPNWTARGAYGDWQRIDFPDGFAFPCGTNLLTGVTLMAWGELRAVGRVALNAPETDSTNSISAAKGLAALPSFVSLEPGASSVAYGLTPSNTFLVSWQNVCVNRSATNRVDASIELFDSGAVLITTQPTNQPTNKLTNYIPPRPPEGFVGSGQDTNWLAAAFPPSDYAAITNKGYDAWLMEDSVGINEENGKYKVSVTIPALPEHGPCYLVVGPYKMVVTEPGTYSFPLEVFEHYEVRTYPTAVPLSFVYDDGFRGEEPQSDLCLQAPPRQMLGAPLILPPVYDIFQEPRFVITPDSVPLSEAPGTRVSLWCNVSGTVQRYCRSIWRTTKVIFRGSREAEVVEAIIEDEVEFILENAKGSCRATLTITPLPYCCPACCGDYCHCDGTCCDCVCGCRSGGGASTNAPPNVSQP